MTEMTVTIVPHRAATPRYPFNATAFFCALVLAPIWITVLTCWTLISLFALPFGAPAYLIVGTPTLLWAVGRMYPGFSNYALLGLLMNIAAWIVCFAVTAPTQGVEQALNWTTFVFGFGLLYAPLYAGMFGYLYARWHPTLRPL